MTGQAGKKVALIGECMLELQGQSFGAMQQSYGGDTLNTAVYLDRCGAAAGLQVAYATGLGEDSLSTGLMQRWAAEGLDLSLVRRIPGRMPGLYLIEVDPEGERSFSYWRDTSAAKAYFEVESTPLEATAGQWDALYLSGISLAILPHAGRERLFALMQQLRERGAAVVFDNNYRPRLWPDIAEARRCYARAYQLANIALVTADDHQALLSLRTLDEGVAAAQDLAPAELLIKRGALATLVRGQGDGWRLAPTETVRRVVDTTAAGDSFAAGYLSRRLQGASALEAATFGNRLAARVIQHRGALIAPELMRDLIASPQ
ncbi:sugar kinase [Roseateles toxinivorans]|uniref:2-dehydro-3-deoxygluconokinase n=1 Tax=Roseateles toxinivorans TaxID=270368 RepID=A0A4V6PV84_9BURK|nr:sugar kinase [Roseateles toxinivorans]TDP75048.1 2-keto-3-deoxygluconate kinase [Roseateles toxinivorans]